MTSPTRSFTNPAYTRIRPFYQVAGGKYGGNAGLFGLCHDICTVSADGNSTITNGPSGHEQRGAASGFPTVPGGHPHPHPRPPGMGKADRLGQRVPLPPPHFTPTEKPFRIGNACVRALFRRLFWCLKSPFVIMFDRGRLVKQKAAAFPLAGGAAVFAFAP